MNILSLPLGADTGGVSAAIGRAFEGQSGWSFRSIISTLNYIDYQADMRWSAETVSEFWRWSDIVHLHHNTIAAYKLTSGWKGFRLPRKPYVVHFHGTGFREYPRQHLAELRRYRATGIAATLDLWLLAPEQLTWIACPVDIERMQAMRREPDPTTIRIAHAPTNREIKSTEQVIAAVDRLQDEGYPVELDLIEGVAWSECLSRKSSADIYVDQVKLGYGNNAIECWGMGIPVIAGGAEPTLEEMERRFGSLPFYNASEATLYDSIRSLVEDAGLRDSYAQRGLQHVRSFHDQQVVVEQLKDLYRQAIEGRRGQAA